MTNYSEFKLDELGLFLNKDIVLSNIPVNNITYDSNDNPTLIEYSNGQTAEITYTSANKVETVTYKDSGGVIDDKWTLSYDSSDRLISSVKDI